jgi:hypothetical protein
MRCPGQDRRYWTEDAVFEVPCPECGASVELFKDETTGRCTGCGHRFRNPGIDFGCAQWCALAEQCLGLVPEGGAEVQSTDGALAGRIIQQVSETLAAEPSRLRRSLKIYHFARQLVAVEGGDPRVVLATALLLDLAQGWRVSRPNGSRTATATPRDILEDVGCDEETITRICENVRCCQSDESGDRVEYRIVRDADTLARLSTQVLAITVDEWTEVIENRLLTEAAKEWVRKWSAGPRQEGNV